MKIPITGTVGILKDTVSAGNLSLKQADEFLCKMVEAGFYSPIRSFADIVLPLRLRFASSFIFYSTAYCLWFRDHCDSRDMTDTDLIVLLVIAEGHSFCNKTA